MRTAHVTNDVCKGVYTLREGKKQIFYYIQGIEDFPMNRLTIIQHHDNPHAVRQTIDVKEALTRRQHSILTLTFSFCILNSYDSLNLNLFNFNFGVKNKIKICLKKTKKIAWEVEF